MIVNSIWDGIVSVLTAIINLLPSFASTTLPNFPLPVADWLANAFTGFTTTIGLMLLWRFIPIGKG